MHFQGARHSLMRKAYYMEIFEQDKVTAEINTILKNVKATIDCMSHTTRGTSNSELILPPGICLSQIHMPEEPLGFKLPPGFDFSNPTNFPRTIEEALQKYR